MRRLFCRWAVIVTIFAASLPLSGQPAALRIVSAAPSGELGQLGDADEVRIVFSEPMVAVGAVAPAPPWVRITPAVPGTFYWSGTRTLIFSPDSSAQMPYSTRFTVRVDATATSAGGRRLGAPYELTFTTPTVRLQGAFWSRKIARYDSPAMIELRFNQPVRAADVVAHATVALTPHDWAAPTLPASTRTRLQSDDAAGLARFDAKVAAVARVTASSDRLAVQVADSLDERRFPSDPARVVLETTTVPPPDAWLTVTLDAALPGVQGVAPHAAQSSILRLEPTFFVSRTQCEAQCNPLAYNPVLLTRPVIMGAFARQVTLVDVTGGAAERPIRADREIDGPIATRVLTQVRLEDAGFAPPTPLRTRRITLPDTLEAQDGQTLGYPWTVDVSYLHAPPSLAMTGEVWEAAGGPLVPVNVRNVTEIEQAASPVTPAEVLPLLQQLLRPPAPAALPRGTSRLAPAADEILRHGMNLAAMLSPGGTGMVHVAVTPRSLLPDAAEPSANEGTRRNGVIQVTNLGLTVKDSPNSTLVFVTRLDTGAPVPGARVSIVATPNAIRWQGTTDADGVALAPALALRLTPPVALEFAVIAEKDGDVAFVGSNWAGDADPRRAGIAYQQGDRPAVFRGSVFTDRGVYRQGDEVHLKAVLRDDTVSGMSLLPNGSPLTVTVLNARGNEVDRRTVPINAFSSIEWNWRVPEDGALGTHRVVVSRGPAPAAPAVNGTFVVAAFRKPQFRVDAAIAGEPPVLGSTLRGTVQARYLFGATLGGRPVRWFFRRSVVQSPPPAVRERFPESGYAVGYLPRPEELAQRPPDPPFAQMTGVLNAAGRLDVAVPTTASGPYAYSYTFEGDVEDATGQHIANRASLVAHPAQLYVALSRPLSFVETSRGTSVNVSTVGLDGASVGGVPVTLQLRREEWAIRPRPENPGILVFQRQEVAAGEWTVRTAAGETPQPIAVPAPGIYTLRATARDADGRETRTEISFCATGAGVAPWRADGNRIALTPERTTWRPGENARILIQSPWPSATALITVEREGVRSHRRFEIHSTQDVVEVPITEADIPNVFVSVVLVKGRTSDQLAADGSDSNRPAYRVGHVELTVENTSRRLQVSMTSDREEYRPRQPANISVTVADARERRLPREVTLWAVDYGMLSLTAYRTPDVLNQIYVRKPLQVMTQDNRQRLISRPERIVPAEPMTTVAVGQGAGRGGGVAGGVPGGVADVQNALEQGRTSAVQFNSATQLAEAVDQGADAVVRQDFRPVVFWLGSATTDADGRAQATVTLPDSLTTYRIMAVAGDGESQFGYAERDVRVTRPVTLTPSLPRFLNTGDRASMTAVITNNGRTRGDAVVTVESRDASLLELTAATSRMVTVGPGESVPVSFDAVGRAAGQARLRITASLGGDTDAFEMPLPIASPWRRETTAAYGDTTSTARETLTLPPGIARDRGGLTIELASTALVGLGEGARFVAEYPFQSAEARASRALTLLLSADLGAAFHLSSIPPADYRREAERALKDLYALQCGDGGFRDWAEQPCRPSSPYLAAYVLHVLHVAATLDVAIDQTVVNRAASFLQTQLRQPPPERQWRPIWGASQAFAVKVLAEHGRKPGADVARLVTSAEQLPVFSLSHLADALEAAGDRGPSYQDITRRLANAVRVDADRAHVEEVDDAALVLLWNSNVRATAVVLDGMARRRDSPELMAPLVRWLLSVRTHGRWATTHENAMALEALTAYYRAYETREPQLTSSVSLDGTSLGTSSFNGRDALTRQLQVTMRELLAGPTTQASARSLAVTAQGTGRLFYATRMETYAPESPAAVDRGFEVRRRFERYVPDGTAAASSSFAAGDLVKVTVSVVLRGEGRFVALTDPVAAGFEALDGQLQTTASDLARVATRQTTSNDFWASFRRGGFDHIEKHDDRVVAFATRLGTGRHEFSYLVRATTAGRFGVAGARMEAMYAPEVTGRSAAETIEVR